MSLNRRRFIGSAASTWGALVSSSVLPHAEAQQPVEHPASPATSQGAAQTPLAGTSVDFAYSPVQRQTAFCFPDDHYKSLIDQNGSLLYGYDMEKDIFYFPLRLDFGLYGMRSGNVVSQTLESPSVPIVTTVIEREDATMKMITFATNRPDEGRVDNVLIEVAPKGTGSPTVSTSILIHGAEQYDFLQDSKKITITRKGAKQNQVLLIGRAFTEFQPIDPKDQDLFTKNGPLEQQFMLHPGPAAAGAPYRAFIRLPQEGQSAEKLQAGLMTPDEQLAGARAFWTSWTPYHDPVSWQIPGREGEFVQACARNILQAREDKAGKLTFQVGPTCYRGLWVVDGNFILEAARYLGYDKEAVEGLKTTWAHQHKNGQVVAAGGLEHYKDTAIAMFTTARQCELAQDWSLLREFQPNIVQALDFIDALRARAKKEGSSLGKYGLLPKGFADGGFDGTKDEFTNTWWTLAGLKAIGAAGEQQNLPHIARASTMYKELRANFDAAAAQEMRSFDGKFSYLPALLKTDETWTLPDPWERPRPQCAQWALSQTIYPGRVFEPNHPVTQGHVNLMKAVVREGIPADTGWNHHEAVWTYNAAFVAEVYLWLGMKQAAYDTFVGFLNHASPQYCWREEQPLQHALVGTYVGDMPHNWASAECIRYVRHSLALEDGMDLRLLAGIVQNSLSANHPYVLKGSPTRFGRIDLTFEPMGRGHGWQLTFRRENGPAPSTVSVPTMLGRNLRLNPGAGVQVKTQGDVAMIDPAKSEWTVTWKS